MRNMVTGCVGDVIVCIHTAQPPSDEEWHEFIVAIKSFKDVSKVRNLVLTEGGAPNSVQRRAVNELLQGKPGVSAVVSGSALVRGVVTALNWFNPYVKTFAPSEVEDAYRYLRLAPKDVEALRVQIPKLKAVLGLGPTSSREP